MDTESRTLVPSSGSSLENRETNSESGHVKIALTVVEARLEHGSIAGFSKATLNRLKLSAEDKLPKNYVTVRGRRDTIFIAQEDQTVADDCIALNDVARKNLVVRTGHKVIVSTTLHLKSIRRIAVWPIEDTVRGYSGDLFDDFLHSYLREAYLPMALGDHFKCQNWTLGWIPEFVVVDVEPPEGGIITYESIVHYEGGTLQRAESPLYDDIGGYKQQLGQLRRIVEFGINRQSWKPATHHHQPQGALLSGPTGSGKTLMMKAMMTELPVAFSFYALSSELLGKNDQDAEKNINLVFKECQSNLPAFLVIEDVDLFKQAGHYITSLFVHLMQQHTEIVIVGTTRHLSAVPQDLLRYGHLSRHIQLNIPSKLDRIEILRVCVRDQKLDDDVSLDAIADSTVGFWAGDIASLCSSAVQSSWERIYAEVDPVDGTIDALTLDSQRVKQQDFLTAFEIELEQVSTRQTTADEVSKDMSSKINEPSFTHSLSEYTVACIFPMGVEYTAGLAMLDEKHDDLPLSRDHNVYTLGKIGQHSVVLAALPETGGNPAASVATQLLNDFGSLRFALLVGVGGGIPSQKHDIRLGDVVVSRPTDTFGGVVQYDLGKRIQAQSKSFERTGTLNKPGWLLQGTVEKLSAVHNLEGSQIPGILKTVIQKKPRMRSKFSPPQDAEDLLFKSTYLHTMPGADTCDDCDPTQLVERKTRPDAEPQIHYGTVGSANVVLRDAKLRDELQADMDLLCVEMEAAGIMDEFPCLVIRGICDYADSHKTKDWQPYAAATAAAYMKELLSNIPAKQVVETKQALDVVRDG